ncbi:holo-ACP synthase [Mesoplasma lactucae]|uniref:Holo-[acyl-carrier-protein] synthase n=1 Tax=Mesoplasma lactucae ATCC 49193 TaxID=81460 RepID=A0A291IRA8_9MOLU|nr:holo-ACP synthase [Mesoplasma lactucae]ATG97475.1 holo-[acyl-carrier-protein] synthase [Mesoplasma lactucae ATCC 49193]ATZ20070.1 holo-[acyl-carrier-protein] synthase [Mesoplasma lactucae ATCC 49193]MCL8216818.1 Holo-[acyl-carrier-protein] synthase [Mesoplasma lactucae ATCC 49193]
MIEQIGTDIVEIKRIKLNDKFLTKVLSTEELKRFNNMSDKKRKREFVAGRWACKEAIIKATDKRVIMNKINIGYNKNGAPIITSKGFENILVSISHEKKYATAIAINQIQDK